ncbi:cation transporter [bacterium]|nr:cation transporter [bacterium]
MSHNHSHHHQEITSENEKKTFIVIIFTVVTMFAEIFYGYITNSMALLADGFHMTCHAVALSLTLIAYILVRKFNNSKYFPNGTNKIGTLGAYTSSLFLGLSGFWIIYEAIERFFNPILIQFNDAILVAIIGLIVNGICIFIMEGKNCNKTGDYNFKAAYYHILADVLTSVLAIFALILGKFLNFVFLDSLIGILGGILILKWAWNLIKDTVLVLIDAKVD